MKHALDVHGHYVVPFLFRRLEDVLGEDDCSVIDQDVYRSKVFERALCGFLRRRPFANVTCDYGDVLSLKVPDGLINVLGNNHSSVFDKARNCCPAYTACRSSYNRNLPIEQI